jgi:hypothetical protein
MKATRRQAIVGALAVPAVASAAKLKAAGAAITVYDASLAPAPALDALPIEGDRIRFARKLFERRPSLVIGLSRHADALLIAEVGQESGYRGVAAPAALGANGWALAPAG